MSIEEQFKADIQRVAKQVKKEVEQEQRELNRRWDLLLMALRNKTVH